MKKNEVMSIIVLNWNRIHYSKITIENIIKRTTVPHVLCLVDNNSTEKSGVRDYLSSITKSKTNAEDVIHVFNDKNLGVSGGRNSGIYAVEQSKYTQDVIFNVDDDIMVPKNYDKCLVEACEKIPKLGISGINVEPFKYPVQMINGVRIRPKTVGNLGGAALALPRRVFKRVGYYGFGRGTIYGHEDSLMRYKMNMLGLLSAYIEPKGIHLDEDKDKEYRKRKNDAHKKGSIQLRELSRAVIEMKRSGNVYTPYTPAEKYNPVDKDIFTNDLMKK